MSTVLPVLLRDVQVGASGPVGDVRIADGQITEIAPHIPADDDVVVCEFSGHTLLPGFVDSHVHSEQWSRHTRRIDVHAAGDPAAAVDLIGADLRAREVIPAPGEIMTAHGFREAVWTQRPHKDLLDAAFGTQPVAVWSMDMHALWLSSAALKVVGMGDHPTGFLRESECMQASVALGSAVSQEVGDQWAREMTYAAAAQGVTQIVDFEFTDTGEMWRRRFERADLGVRVQAGVWPEWLNTAVDRGLGTGDVVDGTRGLLEAGPFKVISDGSLNTRTAYCHDAYPGMDDPAEAYGLLLVSPEELIPLMRRAVGVGLVPAIHAIGDRANALALDAFEALGCGGRIEHAQLVQPEDVARFTRLGVSASVQPQHLVADRDVADRHWAGRTTWAFPYGSLHAAGASLLIGSDAPVSPVAPWQAIADAVARTDDDRPPWHPEQRLPVDVALAAASGGRRRLRVGDRADLTVVPLDPLQADASELREMPVSATLLAGHVTHGAVAV